MTFRLTVFVMLFTMLALSANPVLDIISRIGKNACELDNRVISRMVTKSPESEIDSVIGDFLKYISEMEKKHPDALSADKKQQLVTLLTEMENIISKSSGRPENDEIAFYAVADLIRTAYNEVLYVPFTDADYEKKSSARAKTVTVSVAQASVRSGAGKNFAQVDTVYQGNRMEVIDEEVESSENKTWYKVITPKNKKEGWVSEKVVTVEGESDNNGSDNGGSDDNGSNNSGSTLAPDQYGEVYSGSCTSNKSASVRKYPDPSSETVSTVSSGKSLTISRKYKNWYYVKYSMWGSKGWISGSDVSLAGTDNGGSNDDDNSYSPQPSSDMDKKIIKAALGAEGMSGTVYGIKVYTELTEWGGLACAAVVSAILTEAGMLSYPDEYNVSAQGLKNQLKSNNGYKNIPNDKVDPRDVMPADIVCWKHYAGERERHIGIVVGKDSYGNWMCIDNSGALKYVWKKSLVRPDKYELVDPVIRN